MYTLGKKNKKWNQRVQRVVLVDNNGAQTLTESQIKKTKKERVLDI